MFSTSAQTIQTFENGVICYMESVDDSDYYCHRPTSTLYIPLFKKRIVDTYTNPSYDESLDADTDDEDSQIQRLHYLTISDLGYLEIEDGDIMMYSQGHSVATRSQMLTFRGIMARKRSSIMKDIRRMKECRVGQAAAHASADATVYCDPDDDLYSRHRNLTLLQPGIRLLDAAITRSSDSRGSARV